MDQNSDQFEPTNEVKPEITPETAPAETTSSESTPPLTKVAEMTPKKRKPWLPILLVLAVMLLIGGVTFALKSGKKSTPTATATPMTTPKTSATVKASTSPSVSPSPTTTPVASPTATPTANSSGLVPANFAENAAAALNTMNTAYFAQLMAPGVHVVIAASEFAKDRTPAQAVADLDYFKSATQPWDFNLPESTISAWKTGSYSTYLSSANMFGKAKSGQVVAFTFNTSGKITNIFMSASADLL